jgi:hypothetical protein
MPRRRSIDPFFLIVADRDNGVFTVEGPMTDDRPWNKAVIRAQNDKRHVTCCNGGNDQQEAIRSYGQSYNLRYVAPGSIVAVSGEDRGSS